MREEILDIVKKLYHNHLTIETGTDLLLGLFDVSNRLLAEKIILALDDYGRKVHSIEYGLPIDPDTKDFEDKRLQEMLKIVTDILNGG